MGSDIQVAAPIFLDSCLPDCVAIGRRREQCFRHSGLDSWFDRLTTLSKPVESLEVERVEGESSAFS